MNPSVENQPTMPTSGQPAPGVAADAHTPSMPQPMVPLTAMPSAPVAAQPANTPQQAQDNDMIEREWVTKAKQIIAATKNDPYQQSLQLASLKADYIQKRYNKAIKSSDT